MEKIHLFVCLIWRAKMNSEPNQTSKMQFIAKIVMIVDSTTLSIFLEYLGNQEYFWTEIFWILIFFL